MSGPNRTLGPEPEEYRDSVRDPDLALVKSAQSGDQMAFDALYHSYKGRITGFVGQRVESSSDVPDIVQEIFKKAFLSIGKFRGGSTFSTWLHQIAKNECYSYFRVVCRIPADVIPLEEAGEIVQQPRWDEATATKMAIAEKVLGRMNPERREIIERVLWDGEKTAVIAADLGKKADHIRYVVNEFWKKLWREIDALEHRSATASRRRRK